MGPYLWSTVLFAEISFFTDALPEKKLLNDCSLRCRTTLYSARCRLVRHHSSDGLCLSACLRLCSITLQISVRSSRLCVQQFSLVNVNQREVPRGLCHDSWSRGIPSDCVLLGFRAHRGRDASQVQSSSPLTASRNQSTPPHYLENSRCVSHIRSQSRSLFVRSFRWLCGRAVGRVDLASCSRARIADD